MRLLFLVLCSIVMSNQIFAQEQKITPDDVKKWIIEESKEGGSIDFFSAIKGMENQPIQLPTGEFTTNKGLALYNWSTALREAGILSVKDAIELYKLIKKSDLDEVELKNIKRAFAP